MLALRRPRRGAADEAAPDAAPADPARPWTVTLGLLVAYLEAMAFLALGARDPTGTTGRAAAAGITFVVFGVLVGCLATITRTGSRLARGCLLLPLTAAAVVLVRDDSLAAWSRVLPVLGAAAAAVLLTLLRPSRRFFGDDDTRVGAP